MTSPLISIRTIRTWSWVVVMCLSWAVGRAVYADDWEFFEKRIRPLLAERCYECHGAKKQQGGLRLDSAEGRAKGGDSGPAWVAGDVEASRIIHAVRREDPDFQMPPKKELASSEVALLVEWVRRGAPSPNEPPGTVQSVSPLSRTDHWAYQPLRTGLPPSVRKLEWPKTSVDPFILAGLEAKGLSPAPEAEAAVLGRRLYFDLVGLPPSPHQLAAFAQAVQQDRSAAVARLVDELLASPRFGERWARHWFDVVRFAESVTLRGFIFPEAWRYRDYVIDAFNRDLPVDEFVREQIAGDLLGGDSVEQRQRRLIATTFLALGNTNLEEQDKRQLDMDVVDEQLDVLGKVFLGQALGCARCHDHKFDPIPTREYYALAGILASTRMLEHANVSKWVERPLPLPEAEESVVRAREEHGARLAAQIETLKSELKQLTALAASNSIPSVLGRELPGVVVDDSMATAVGEWRVSNQIRPFIESGYRHDDNAGKGAKTLTFHPEIRVSGTYEVRLAYTPGDTRATAVPVTVFSADGEVTLKVNQREKPTVDGRFVSLGRHRFEASGAGFVLVSNEGTTGHVVADAVQFLPVDAAAAGLPELAASGGSAHSRSNNPATELERRLKEVEAERKQWLSTGPKRPAAMAPTEAKPIDVPVHRRGSVHTLGEVVPRGVLTVAFRAPVEPMPSDASGRLELANWLTTVDHPLTSRVFVNRVWHWLFGAGLVRSVYNFGTTGDAPSHPELLDYLARRFMEEGWSVKWLVRELVRSQAYQQAGRVESVGQATDPENRLLGHFPRRRLEAECLRDAMLAISGELDLTLPAGPTFDPKREADFGFTTGEMRRSVYLPVFRNALPELLTVFDLADPSMVVGARNRSTVAPQALFLMNHEFVRERARVAARKWLDGTIPEADRVDQVCWTILGRRPLPGERALAERYLRSVTDPVEGWADLVQALFASLDFRYVD